MSNPTPPVCNYDGSDYQTQFWDEGQRAYEDGVEAVALKRLLPRQGTLLLEVGAGAGRNTPRYEGFERIVLLDYSYTQLQQARERLGDNSRYIYVAADVYRLPFIPGLFGSATMIRTLHHMTEPLLALQQIHQVMRPDGVFILEYANKQNLKAILRYLFRQQKWNPFSLEAVEFAPLNFDFHPQAVRDWLKTSGFNLERQLTVSHFRMSWLKRLLPTSLLVNLDGLAQLSGDAWQLSPSVFVRSHAVGDTPTTPLDAFFRCPACQYWPLYEANGLLPCTNCGAQWQFKDGIYDFRQPVGTNEQMSK
jgi:ubiquinone/menaquinone biosynthesis C-methylase UbiE